MAREGSRGGRCLDAIARVVDGVADPALAFLVGFEETVVATQIDLCYVRLVHATGVGAWRGQKPDSAALRQDIRTPPLPLCARGVGA